MSVIIVSMMIMRASINTIKYRIFLLVQVVAGVSLYKIISILMLDHLDSDFKEWALFTLYAMFALFIGLANRRIIFKGKTGLKGN